MKKVNLPRRFNNSKIVCIQQYKFQIYTEQSGKSKRWSAKIHNEEDFNTHFS